MNILNLLVLIPVLTVIGIVFTKDYKGARVAAAVGMTLQLIATIVLVFSYFAQSRFTHSVNQTTVAFLPVIGSRR